MFVVAIVFVAPKLSNIAAGQSVAAPVGTSTGHCHPFCFGLVASLRCNYHNHLPVQTLLLLSITTISAAAAASTTIAVPIFAGRLIVMLFSHNCFVCIATV
jgi:hypothetical protein